MRYGRPQSHFNEPRARVIDVRGDLMAAPERLLLHGCNAQGVMGSGVAKLVRDAHPGAYDVYRAAYESRTDKSRGLDLGSYTVFKDTDRTIINGVTQEFYGREPNRVYVSYAAIERLFLDLNHQPLTENQAIAIPRIGAGLAQGDWKTIREIIAESVQSYYVTIYSQE